MFWKSMGGIGNDALTENLDRAFVSTLDPVLDLFSRGGAMRNRDESDMLKLFVRAFSTDPLLSTKCLFYLRDIRGGAGERKFFRTILAWMAAMNPEVVIKNFAQIPEMGRWDDLFVLFDTPIESKMVDFVLMQFISDTGSDHPSLLAKWMPSENASSKVTKNQAKRFIKKLGWSPSKYRKTLTALRKKLDVVERKMSSNAWGLIAYDHVPSRANFLYKKAFQRHDEDRYNAFISAVVKGEKKMNASVLYPHEIVGKILGQHVAYSDVMSLEALWKSLPDFAGDQSAIVMCDTSGSMSGQPITISVGLALYFAQRNKNPAFKDFFMTFSARPELQHVVGRTIVEKVINLSQAHWDGNTDLRLAFLTILDRAKQNAVPAEEMPKVLYVISDMQFDSAFNGRSTYEDVKQMYEARGYKLPTLVFWNVNAYMDNSPVTMHDDNTMLVSGTSPVAFKYVLESKTKNPVGFMKEVLGKERYAKIAV